MRLLFLDIDGVLNSHAYFLARDPNERSTTAEEHARLMIDPSAVEHLNVILEASDATVVISSSWRIAYPLGEISRALSARGFRRPRAIIGKTPSGGGERGHEIEAWLQGYPGAVDAFAILDDSDDMGPYLPRLVRTDYQTGLRAEHVPQVLALLTPDKPAPAAAVGPKAGSDKA